MGNIMTLKTHRNGMRLLLSLLCILTLWAASVSESEAQRRGGNSGGGYRPPPTNTPLPSRPTIKPRFNTASGAVRPQPSTRGGGQGSFVSAIKPSSPVASLPGFKGQMTTKGVPIVQIRGRNWGIPQQGVLSTRAKLLGGTSAVAVSTAWTDEKRILLKEFSKPRNKSSRTSSRQIFVDAKRSGQVISSRSKSGLNIGSLQISASAIAKIPTTWGEGIPNKSAEGWRWSDPLDKGSGVRVDKGDTKNSLESQKVDHVIVRYNGKVLGRDGRPISGSIRSDSDNAHIPLSEWSSWKKWNEP